MNHRFLPVLYVFVTILSVATLQARHVPCRMEAVCGSAQGEAEAAFRYLLQEVERDARLSHDKQQEMVFEFQKFEQRLSSEAASRLVCLLLQETRARILEMLRHAQLGPLEIKAYLGDYEKVIGGAEQMTVELARQMLFFVAELKIHRQLVYDFGVALGCPEKQLLRHDLCKLRVEQFEGYARYFRGGRLEEDKLGYLAAWEHHQLEEHHHESYSQEGFDFESFPKERLRDNMLEAVADLLAATKQRGGSSLIDWLVHVFPKKKPNPRILPYLEEALKKAHAHYLISEEKGDSESLFKGLPCWNRDVEEVFRKLKTAGPAARQIYNAPR